MKQSICGMSVVGNDFEALKKYNLAEIYASKGPLKSIAADEAYAEGTPS